MKTVYLDYIAHGGDPIADLLAVIGLFAATFGLLAAPYGTTAGAM